MFCKNCGSQIQGDEKYCQYCGTSLAQTTETENILNKNVQYNTSNENHDNKTTNQNTMQISSKKWVGILLGLFLGILGLIIGVLMFTNEYERKTFIKGWLISLAISAGLIVLYFVAVFGIIGSIA